MKKIDFSKTGGMPFSQDRLNYMQSSYAELLGALANIGLDPNAASNTAVRLTGMLPDGMGNISSGWFVYNGEIIAFTGGAIPALTSGNAQYIDITTTTTNLTYNNSSVYPVISDKNSAMTLHTVGTANSSSTFAYLSVQWWGKELNYTAINFSNVGNGNVHGIINYKKIFATNQLFVQGYITTTTAASIPTTPISEIICTLPFAYRPAVQQYCIMNAMNGLYYALDGSGNIITIQINIETGGNVNVMLVKPGLGQYTIQVSFFINLD